MGVKFGVAIPMSCIREADRQVSDENLTKAILAGLNPSLGSELGDAPKAQ